MQRTPEPRELMDDDAQARAYADADFSEPNKLFAALLHQLRPQGLSGRALDLGCGPADIPFALLEQYSQLHIDALDAAWAMLALAREKLNTRPELKDRLNLMQEFLPCEVLAPSHYDLVISNSLLHHLSDPDDLWHSIHHSARRGAAILVMDLARPRSPLAVDSLVEIHALNESDILRQDFRNSLHAAYTPDEVREQLHGNGLGYLKVEMVSDRHWAVRGTFNSL